LPRLAWRAGALMAVAAGLFLGTGACVEQDDDKPTQDDMKVVKANILAVAPTPRFAANADLEGKVVYLGLDVEPATIEPGRPVKLTHYWKAVSSPGDGWRVFTHIEGPKNQRFINADHGPVGGKYPVSQWKPGEIIKDEHTITLPADWSFDTVLIYSGLWRGPTRLAVKSGPSDGSNRILAATIPVKVAAKADTRKRYVARKIGTNAGKGIKIDGKLDEPAWASAPSTGAFVNTLNGGPVEQSTEAKLLWDDKALYVAFNVADTDAWSNLTKRDDKLWTQEAVELMIDADKNGKGYVEFQVAPNGNVFDTYLPEYRKYEDSIDPKRKPYSFNAKLNVAVVVDGTLNKHDDKDKGWTVELAIPLEDVKGLDTKAELPRLPPRPGDVWRINMFRMDQPEGKPQQASGWSPPLVGDFHALDRFGELVFGDEQGNVAPPPPPAAMAIGTPGALDPRTELAKPAHGKRKGGKHAASPSH
jgi:Carbohydrate family 9 binding domain-like